MLAFADLKSYLLRVPGKDQVTPMWSHLHHKAKLFPLSNQVQANHYLNLKFDINNNNNRKLIYNNNHHQMIKAKLQVLHRMARGQTFQVLLFPIPPSHPALMMMMMMMMPPTTMMVKARIQIMMKIKWPHKNLFLWPILVVNILLQDICASSLIPCAMLLEI